MNNQTNHIDQSTESILSQDMLQSLLHEIQAAWQADLDESRSQGNVKEQSAWFAGIDEGASRHKSKVILMGNRYCNIECKSLEDIRETCKRHIRNAQVSLLDCVDAEDLTDNDSFYLDLIERMWHDLLLDVETMLNKQSISE